MRRTPIIPVKLIQEEQEGITFRRPVSNLKIKPETNKHRLIRVIYRLYISESGTWFTRRKIHNNYGKDAWSGGAYGTIFDTLEWLIKNGYVERDSSKRTHLFRITGRGIVAAKNLGFYTGKKYGTFIHEHDYPSGRI